MRITSSINRLLLIGLLATTAVAQKPDKQAVRDAILKEADRKAFAENMKRYDGVVEPYLRKHCISCHGPDRLEGDLALDLLDADMKESASAARWTVVREKISTGEMPPDGSPRPAAADTAGVVEWIRLEMKRARRNFTRRVQHIHGNHTDHRKLFDPRNSTPLQVPPVIRRLSPQIYEAFRREQAKGFENLVGNPFTSDPRFLFRDMGAPQMDVPTTSQLIRNALTIVERQTGHRLENGQLKTLPGAKKEFVAWMDPQKALDEKGMATLVRMQFQRTLGRTPTEDESQRFVDLMRRSVEDAGRIAGIRYSLAAVYLLPSAVFRFEVGEFIKGEATVRLSSHETACALAYALTDRRPSDSLLKLAGDGGLATRSQVANAVRQMLDDDRLAKPRILRFFHEFFEYPKATDVFKNPEDFRYHKARVLVSDTDNLVNWILERDEEVLRELLTTDYCFVNTRMDGNRKVLVQYEARGQIHQSYSLPPDWKFTDQQPIRMPGIRAGILTQPSWLVAWSMNQDNHAILRGKWVRERLLGNVVPDIPITVDAQLPEAPDQSLRTRMNVTREDYCWQCHKLMNDVGLPFETYDHFGRWRALELKRPVDASGGIDLTGDPRIDGTQTNDAIQFVRSLAESERVEQVFIRHVFRYFTGRNENEGDGRTLQAAQQAYRDSGGSFRELIVSILSSDSFLYRTPSSNAAE